ncbi:calmodulin-regulated spectrin-associated protein 1a [Chanos chanos]|uniref:Calmodulin-regulated spectrin-associated protein 1a n=1 Tax=Chanos chanos TaxID=29144 RepID=A0A6J2UV93_CHACN|nr:calmodulin-regulated spectrin-associated protein 1-B-like [Chanos chanos]
MDVDVCSGGEAGQRRGNSAGLEILPLELYDSARAKIEANLRWLFAKAYGEDHIPADLRDPFYTDQYSVEHIKPAVLGLLLSADLYCRVCGLLLQQGEQGSSLNSHQSVIQVLARRGIYVHESDNTPVSHDDLSSTPIKMSSHIPLIDGLMLAYSVKLMSIEKVVASVKRFSAFSASKELPFDTEDAMVFWINKVILKTREISEKEVKLKQQLMESPCHQKPDLMNALAHCMLEPVEFSRVVRYRRDHLSGHTLPHMRVVEELMRDVCDGTALLTVIHYYCPQCMRLQDICLKEVLSLADSVYNVDLLREFCNEYLNRCFYLHTEDLLYAPPVLKYNVMVFIAELFWWFEVVKPDFVQPRDLQEIKDVRSALQPKSTRPHVPISNATKRSFQATPAADVSMVTGPNPDTCMRYYLHSEESVPGTKESPTRSPSHTLLPLRQRQQKPTQGEETSELRNRSNSLSRMEGHKLGSRLAWAERRQRPLSGMDVDWDRMCFDSISLARSISKDSLASNIISITPKHCLNGQPRPLHHDNPDQEEELVTLVSTEGVASGVGPSPESFFLEPLQPAALRVNKEKNDMASKREESGEGRMGRKGGEQTQSHTEHTYCPEQTSYTVSQPFSEPQHKHTLVHTQQSGSFFLHGDNGYIRKDSVSDFEEDDDEDNDFEDEEQRELAKELLQHAGSKWAGLREEEEESLKLHEEECIREREDKEDISNFSGRSSPCPSTLSHASSTSTGRMTSFAERRMQRTGQLQDSCCSYSTGSSLATTPDGSEGAPSLYAKPAVAQADTATGVRPGLASELVQLRMQLEEKRRAIESQKRKIETLTARQRLQLGKAAFLNVVKKGRGRETPLRLLKHQEKSRLGKDKEEEEEEQNQTKEEDGAWEDGGGELDLSECSRSIELLNDAICSIQQQMMQLSLQQDMLMKQSMQSPPEQTHQLTHTHSAESPHEQKNTPQQQSEAIKPAVQFMESVTLPTRRPPRLSSGRTPRLKPTDLKFSKGSKFNTTGDTKPSPGGGRTPRSEGEEEGGAKEGGRGLSRGAARSATFKLHDAVNRRRSGSRSPERSPLSLPPTVDPIPIPAELARERSVSGGSGKENNEPGEESRAKAQLIEVDLSELPPDSTSTSTEPPDPEQKSGLGFFFKDDQKAEDELAKKRAAFLLKQQRKAEETRLRKLQLEAESELKRDEARRKAEEERARKEEEKARRELIKQDYLRRKQQQLMEEQGVAKPRPRTRKPRPKSLHRGESATPEGLGNAPSGSSLSLASAATEADSVMSGGGSQRGDSVDSFPLLNRNVSKNFERDWDNGSTASSITSVAEYSGPRLYKEPSVKSNKPIIHNAIAHCCLAGKVNEAQKNAILEELERCESNHLIILFRDGGCQFRALYCYSPDTEEIVKLTGTGPKSISRKMIDKLYKYSSDRKQFTVIPAKTVSVSVDALTIHNHLWQTKRPTTSSTKRK